MRFALATFAILSVSLILPVAAHAETIDFTLTGDGNVITFPLTPNLFGTFYPQVDEFSSEPLADVVNGVPSEGGLIFFLLAPNATGFDLIADIPSLGTLGFDGPNLLADFGDDPLLVDGTYQLTTIDGDIPYTLTVGPETTSVVPEPPTLSLFLCGVLIACFWAVRRRSLPFEPQ